MKYVVLLLIIFFISCSNDIENVQLKYNRFEKDLFIINSNNIDSHLVKIKENHSDFYEFFETEILFRNNMKSELFHNELLAFVNHQDMREAYDSVMVSYIEISDIEQDLNLVFTKINKLFHEYPLPVITTFFGGFNYGVVTYKNNIGIGLENFLGSSSKFYKLLGNPEYLRFQKKKKYIAPNVVEAWCNKHFQKYQSGRDLLSNIVYKGKIIFLMKEVLSNDLEPEDKFRFSKSQLDWVKANEKSVWSYFIANDLLYSNYERDFRTFINYGPFSKGMPSEAPARVGYFIGYRIIESYMRRNNMPIDELFYETDAKKILNKSKYKPLR